MFQFLAAGSASTDRCADCGGRRSVQSFLSIGNSAAGARASSRTSLDLWQRDGRGTNRIQSRNSSLCARRQEMFNTSVPTRYQASKATAVLILGKSFVYVLWKSDDESFHRGKIIAQILQGMGKLSLNIYNRRLISRTCARGSATRILVYSHFRGRILL